MNQFVVSPHQLLLFVFRRHCRPHERPKSAELCVLPRDCLVSHWTNWTSFSQALHTAASSRVLLLRQRNVIQVPRGLGATCPYLHDERAPTPGDVPDTCHL